MDNSSSLGVEESVNHLRYEETDDCNHLHQLLLLAQQLKDSLSPGTEKAVRLHTALCALMDDLRSLSHTSQGSQLSCTPRFVVTGADAHEVRSLTDFLLYPAGGSNRMRGDSDPSRLKLDQRNLESPTLGSSWSTDTSPLGHAMTVDVSCSQVRLPGASRSPSDSEDIGRALPPVGRPSFRRRSSNEVHCDADNVVPDTPSNSNVNNNNNSRSLGANSTGAVTFALHATPPVATTVSNRDGMSPPAPPGRRSSVGIMMKSATQDVTTLPPLPHPPEMPQNNRRQRLSTLPTGLELTNLEPSSSGAAVAESGPFAAGSAVQYARRSPCASPMTQQTRHSSAPMFLRSQHTNMSPTLRSPKWNRTETFRPGTFERTLADRVSARWADATSEAGGMTAANVELYNKLRSSSFLCCPGNISVSWMLEELGECVVRYEQGTALTFSAHEESPHLPMTTVGDTYCICVSSRDVGRPALSDVMRFLFGPFMPNIVNYAFPPTPAKRRGSSSSGGANSNKNNTNGIDADVALRVRKSIAASTFFVLSGCECIDKRNQSAPQSPTTVPPPPPIAHSIADLVGRFTAQMSDLFGVEIRPWQVIPYSGPVCLLVRDLLLSALPCDEQWNAAAGSQLVPAAGEGRKTTVQLQRSNSMSSSQKSQLTSAVQRYCDGVYGSAFRDRMAGKDGGVSEAELLHVALLDATGESWRRCGAWQLCKTLNYFEHFAFSYVLGQAAVSIMMWTAQLLVMLPSAADAAHKRAEKIKARVTASHNRQKRLASGITATKAMSPNICIGRSRDRVQQMFSALVERFLRDLRIMIVLQEEPREIDVFATPALSTAYDRLRRLIRHFKSFYCEGQWELSYKALQLRISKALATHKQKMDRYIASHPDIINDMPPLMWEKQSERSSEKSTPAMRFPSSEDIETSFSARERRGSREKRARIAQAADPDFGGRMQKLLAVRSEQEKQLVVQLSQLNTEIINFFTAVCISQTRSIEVALLEETRSVAKSYKGILKNLSSTRPSVNAVPAAAIRSMVERLAQHPHVVSLQVRNIMQPFMTAVRAALCEDQVRALAKYRNTVKERKASSFELSLELSNPGSSLSENECDAALPRTQSQRVLPRDTALTQRFISTAEDYFCGSDAMQATETSASSTGSMTYQLAARTARYLDDHSYATLELRPRQSSVMSGSPLIDVASGSKCDAVVDPEFFAAPEAVGFPRTRSAASRAGSENYSSGESESPMKITALGRKSTVRYVEMDGGSGDQQRSEWAQKLQSWRLDTAPHVRPMYFSEQPALWVLLDVWDEALLPMRFQPWLQYGESRYVDALNEVGAELLTSQDAWLRRLDELTSEFEAQYTDAADEEIWLKGEKPVGPEGSLPSAKERVEHILAEAASISDSLDAIHDCAMKAVMAETNGGLY